MVSPLSFRWASAGEGRADFPWFREWGASPEGRFGTSCRAIASVVARRRVSVRCLPAGAGAQAGGSVPRAGAGGSCSAAANVLAKARGGRSSRPKKPAASASSLATGSPCSRSAR